MYSAMSTMMELTEPEEVVCTFNPSSDRVWIADAGIVSFQPSEVNSILQAELDVRMVQLKSACTLCVIIAVKSNGALRRRLSSLAEMVEIHIVGIVLAGRVRRVVDRVGVRSLLQVGRRVAGHGYRAA